MEYQTNPYNVLKNGLTLLQENPHCAANLNVGENTYGWLYTKGPDGQWATSRKLSPGEIEMACDQAADMAVLQGTKVRGG